MGLSEVASLRASSNGLTVVISMTDFGFDYCAKYTGCQVTGWLQLWWLPSPDARGDG